MREDVIEPPSTKEEGRNLRTHSSFVQLPCAINEQQPQLVSLPRSRPLPRLAVSFSST